MKDLRLTVIPKVPAPGGLFFGKKGGGGGKVKWFRNAQYLFFEEGVGSFGGRKGDLGGR